MQISSPMMVLGLSGSIVTGSLPTLLMTRFGVVEERWVVGVGWKMREGVGMAEKKETKERGKIIYIFW